MGRDHYRRGRQGVCAGNDLKWQAAGGKRGWDTGGFAGLTSRFDCDKPIIAAVNGVAMGGGFEIALACDLIIASENATFALPEPRVGLAALAGGLHRLPRQIGLKRAMGMILTARHVSAREGHELGFVNEVVPAGEALAAAERWAETICKNSPMSIRASKQTIQKGLAVSLEQAIAEQREYPAVKGDGRVAGLHRGTEGVFRKAPTEMDGEMTPVIPGWRVSTRPGISRFRVRCFASPRNDGCYFPKNFAGRFSRNAAIPSLKSSVAPAMRWDSNSRLSCCS